MSENHSNGPMRWDEHARGGAGGWVSASEDGAGPPDGAGPDPAPDPGRSRRTVPGKYVLVMVGGGLAIAAVVLVVTHAVRSPPPDASHTPSPSGSSRALTGSTADPGPSGSPTVTAEAQATAVDGLLERSESDRRQVVDAVNAIEACASDEAVAAAGESLDEAAVRRDELVAGLAALDVSALGSGAGATAGLRTGWQHSADADRAFADWADDAQGCSPGSVPRTASYRKGVRSSELATGAKEEFLSLWKPIAERYGLPERDTAEL
ncbi:hypothetical protein ACFQ6U_11265 [Streptomyces sp. NPDC056465]|uniref:hypothetical protein n=1 Tax=unclassified Streptomyces TaxID=2593676 RepID=UPI0035E01C03